MTAPLGFNSTTDDVLAGIDLSGKRILVTGVSAGLGVETARALTAHGASVVGTARDLAKARAATAQIPGIELVEMDLASLASVRACADGLTAGADHGGLDEQGRRDQHRRAVARLVKWRGNQSRRQ